MTNANVHRAYGAGNWPAASAYSSIPGQWLWSRWAAMRRPGIAGAQRRRGPRARLVPAAMACRRHRTRRVAQAGRQRANMAGLVERARRSLVRRDRRRGARGSSGARRGTIEARSTTTRSASSPRLALAAPKCIWWEDARTGTTSRRAAPVQAAARNWRNSDVRRPGPVAAGAAAPTPIGATIVTEVPR